MESAEREQILGMCAPGSPSPRKRSLDSDDSYCGSRYTRTSARKRRRVRSIKALFPTMETALVAYITELRDKGLAVHQKAIREKAKTLMADHYPKEAAGFRASTGWCYRFMKRQHLVERRVTRYVI